MNRTDPQRKKEIGFALLTALGKFVFMDWLNWKLFFMATAIITWSYYIYRQNKQQTGILKHWGFRTDNFKEVLQLVLPFALFAVITFFVIGYFRNTLNLTWHILPLLLLYPIWGTIQQFLVIGLVAGNLQDMDSFKLKNHWIILATSFLFSAVHYPSQWLMLGTFILSLFYGWVYLQKRNVYILGCLHGLLAALFYYTIVGSDPFMDIFGSLSK